MNYKLLSPSKPEQRKSKSAVGASIVIAMMMLFPCFTTACQPTPKKAVVENKGDDTLNEAIMQTANPLSNSLQNTRIMLSRKNNTETITVNIDANVVLPGDKKITVARLRREYFTQGQVDNIIRVFFGDNLTFYNPLISTKADIQQMIIRMKQRLTDEEALLNCDFAKEEGVTDIDVIKAHVNKRIKELEKQYNNAPAEAPVITKLDIDSKWINADVEFDRDHLGHIDYNQSLSSRQSFSCYAFGDDLENGRLLHSTTSTPIDIKTNDSDYVAAKQAAQKLIDDMSIKGVRVGDAFISFDNVGDTDIEGKTTLASDRQFYVFCFERVVGERTIDFSFFSGSYTGDDEVMVTVPYEQMQVWVEGDRVVKFLWSNPLAITEIVNDNTAIQVGYEEALESAVNHLFIKYAFMLKGNSAYVKSITAKISGIELDMMRLKEKNTGNYISVPVWKFYGDIMVNDATGNPRSLTSYVGPNIVTVNALDGSIIDMEKGY